MFMYFHWKHEWPRIFLFCHGSWKHVYVFSLKTEMTNNLAFFANLNGRSRGRSGRALQQFHQFLMRSQQNDEIHLRSRKRFFFCQGKCILRIKIECNLIEFARIKEVVIEVDWLRRRSRSRNVWSRSTNRIRCGLRGRHLLPDPNWTPHLANV